MLRTLVTCGLTSLSILFSIPALAYYQDKFNPNSRTFDPSNAGYYKNVKNRNFASGGYNGYPVFQSRNYSYPSQREPTGRPVFIYDPTKLSWAVYDEGGQLVKTGPGSSGSNYCSDLGRSCRTPSGTYHIYSKQGPYYRSKIFPLPRGGAPMPYAMFFRGGYAVHGSYSLPPFNASHGCIRVAPQDAEWLSRNILTYGSTVIVKPYNSSS